MEGKNESRTESVSGGSNGLASMVYRHGDGGCTCVVVGRLSDDTDTEPHTDSYDNDNHNPACARSDANAVPYTGPDC